MFEQLGHDAKIVAVERVERRIEALERVRNELTRHSLRIFFARRVDVGDDDVSRAFKGARKLRGERERARHAVRLKDDGDSLVTGRASRREHRRHLTGQVRVVVVDVDAAPGSSILVSPRRPDEVRQSPHDGVGTNAHRARERGDDRGVRDVVRAGDTKVTSKESAWPAPNGTTPHAARARLEDTRHASTHSSLRRPRREDATPPDVLRDRLPTRRPDHSCARQVGEAGLQRFDRSVEVEMVGFDGREIPSA